MKRRTKNAECIPLDIRRGEARLAGYLRRHPVTPGALLTALVNAGSLTRITQGNPPVIGKATR